MDLTETEVVEVWLWYGKCTYSERNDINTEHLFFVSLKTLNKERKNKNKKSAHTGGGAVTSWLVCSTPERFEPWPGTLRCVLRQDT